MSKVFPDKKFGLYGKYGKLEEMENLSDINEEEGEKKGWWRWSDIKENKIVKAFEMQQMYVCWSSFHLSSTLSICLIFSYSLKLLKIADATVVSECQSKCNVHPLLFFFLFAQLWALKRTLCAYTHNCNWTNIVFFLQSYLIPIYYCTISPRYHVQNFAELLCS